MLHPNKTIIIIISPTKIKEKGNEKFDDHDKNHGIIII